METSLSSIQNMGEEEMKGRLALALLKDSMKEEGMVIINKYRTSLF
jgi:hypothetical protein